MKVNIKKTIVYYEKELCLSNLLNVERLIQYCFKVV